MKGRLLVLDRDSEGRGRAALLEDGRLDDLLVDPARGDATPLPGAIYLGRVERLIPKMGGAFLALGDGQTGLLREAKGVKEGMLLPVQPVSLPEPGKAAPVTRRLLHKGRLAILTPGAPGVNVSRRIRNEEERARLEAIATHAMGACEDECGAILRSAAEGADAEELRAEITALATRKGDIAARCAEMRKPGRLAASPGAIATALNEWCVPPPARILIGPGAHTEVLPPSLAETASSDADPFEALGVWEAVESLGAATVPLPSGGSLSVEATRALVAVDVNTGGGFSASSGVTASIEAARELPRQLRLRGLGGIVVVDFAPVPKRERKRLEQVLKAAFASDPVESSLVGWTTLGLYEIQRKRERRPLTLA